MPYRMVIFAMDRADGKRKKGDIAGILRPDQDWGSKVILPLFGKVEVTDGANFAQATAYIDQWRLSYVFSILNNQPTFTQYKVEVDPDVIAASDKGRAEIKAEMQSYIEDAEPGSIWEGSTVDGFTSNSITVTIPKPHSREELKNDFNDKFIDVLEINRYYFKESGVDWVIAQGGEVQVTQAQVLNNIIDRLDE